MADPGGGAGGPDPPPLLGHDVLYFVGFLTLGPKLDPPPLFACRPKKMQWRRAAVADFLRADDVTRTMSKGGVLVKNPVSATWTPPPSEILDPPLTWLYIICIPCQIQASSKHPALTSLGRSPSIQGLLSYD